MNINKKVKNAETREYNGVKFKSSLELFCYKALEDNHIGFIYQPQKIILLEKGELEFPCYEVQGKIYRDENKKISKSTKRFDTYQSFGNITYTPDFSGIDSKWIIETKGFANDSFPLKWKMLKRHLIEIGFDGLLMKPTNQKEVLRCIELIKEFEGDKDEH